MKKTLTVLMVTMAMLFGLVGCADPGDTATPDGGTETPGGVTETPSAVPGISASPKPSATTPNDELTYNFDLEEMTMPFWQSSTMYNECISFHEDSAGNITAKLLFKPIQVIAVKDNSLKIDLVEGVHYKFDENNPQTLIWLAGDENFVIPYFKSGEVTSTHQDSCGTPGIIGNCMYCVGEWLYSKQLAITYTYDINENEAPHAEYSGALLPKTISKLKNGEDLKIIIYGDSIFTGCDSSASYGRDPKTPTFIQLLKDQLGAFYPNANIKVSNPSVGGWQATNGLENVDKLVTRRNPDLVILGFGMNDANVSGGKEAEYMQQMMDAILVSNPDCEFIVVSTFHANPDIGWDIQQGTHAAGFKTLEKVGVATMDMYKLHTYILERKYYQDTTGNNVNHPNDWFARQYASQLLTMLYDYNA